MTITIRDVTPRAHYIATDGQTVFAIPFEWMANGDLQVWVNNVQCTFDAPPLDALHYSTSGEGINGGGSLTFGPPGRTFGDEVIIYRDIPVASPVDFPTAGVFPVASLNDAFDKMTAMIQQTEVNVVQRSLRLYPDDFVQPLNPIPYKEERAGKLLGFDQYGQPTVVAAGAGGGGGSGGAPVWTGPNPPPLPYTDGDLWWDTDTGGLYVWYDDGSSAQWVQVAGPGGSMNYPPNSPIAFGATGDGVADDTVAYQQAELQFSAIYLPIGKVFKLPTYVPTKPAYGPGALLRGAYTVDAIEVKHKSDRSSMVANTRTPGGDDWLYGTFPSASNHGNTLFGAGIKDSNNASTVRFSAFGALIGTKGVTLDRISAFGQGVLRNTKYAERIDAFGTLCAQWGGANLGEDTSDKFYYHDLIYNGGGAKLVLGAAGSYTLNPAWTASNLYGLSATVGQSIVDWLNTNPWPTTTDHFSYTQAFGRDALCEIVKGSDNVALGYRASALLLEGSGNTTVGNNALWQNVFGNQNTAVGKFAGGRHQVGDNNVYLGRNSGHYHETGAGSIFIGVNAGNPSTPAPFTADWSVFIGQDAGVNLDGSIAANLSNRLFIHDRYTRNPLLNGDFSAGTLGINLPLAQLPKGTLHVFSGASGLAALATSGDDFIVEGGGNTGMSILSGTTSTGSLMFGDSGGATMGYVQYDHTGDFLRFGVGSNERMRITTTGMGFNGAAPIAKPTAVAVTIAAVHAALVSYGLIAA